MDQATPTTSTTTPAPQEPGHSRRGIFAGIAGLTGLAIVTPATGRPAVNGTGGDADFIRAIEGLYDNGGLAARHALAAGMRPDELFCILNSRKPGDDPMAWPALLFRIKSNDHSATFRPRGRDI